MATRKQSRKVTKTQSSRATRKGAKTAKPATGIKRKTRAAAASKRKPSRVIAPPTETVRIQPAPVAGMILIWEDDPESTPPRQPVQVPIPSLPTGALGLTIAETAPAAEIHPVGTSRFRYWVAAEALSRGMQFWGPILPQGTRWATPTGTLQVSLDLGDELNAYYRRDANQLEFYHKTVTGKTVYSGESPNIVCHELGHAVLDAIRPQLFNAVMIEPAAFHESFGDMSAILCALQLNSIAETVLIETGGKLYRSTLLSRIAEQLGWAIRQGFPQAVEPDCLRNAVNSFFYRDPTTLPTTAPASALSSAPHSFSRVFTAAFYEALAGMVVTDSSTPTVQSVQRVTRDAGRLLIDAITKAPVVPNYFSQVAAQMIAADESRFSRKYRDVLKSSFVRHGILSLEAASSIVGKSIPMSMMAGVSAMAGTSTVSAISTAELIPINVPATSYGLDVPSILCAASGEVGGFAVASAAALDTGSLTPPSVAAAAGSFLEDLFRLGRVDIGEHGNPDTKIAQPTVRKTHSLVETNAGPMLIRETFDCGFDYA